MRVTVSFEIDEAVLNEHWFETTHVPHFLLNMPGLVEKAEISYSDGRAVVVENEELVSGEGDRVQ